MRIMNMTGNVSTRGAAALGAAFATSLLLAACATTTTTTETVPVADRDHFIVTLAEDGTLIGKYDAASFNQNVVRQVLDKGCVNGKVSSYNEMMGADGLMEFKASCDGGVKDITGTVAYQKAVAQAAEQ